jgi:hypothetical protein
MFFTYCKGSAAYSDCGSTDLTARGTWQSLDLASLPYYTWTNSTAKQYKACYYTISVDDYTYMDGSKINMYVKNSSNMQITVFGGTSRTNTSFVVS